jgi:aryl-alcohol dehydrogenase-like predicted oxidoreductase
MKGLMLGKMNCCASFVCLQAELSLIVRGTKWELHPLCREEGLAFLAWSPLACGWLTRKYRKDKKPLADNRIGRRDRWDNQPEQRESDLT